MKTPNLKLACCKTLASKHHDRQWPYATAFVQTKQCKQEQCTLQPLQNHCRSARSTTAAPHCDSPAAMVRTRRQVKEDDAAKAGKRWPYAAAAAIIAIVAAHYYNATVVRSDDLGTGSMFDRIAPHYDRANDFMSLGLHHGWRAALIDGLDVQKSDRALDLATGTADVAILQGKRGATVLGVDPSQNMLDIGRGKVTEAGLDDVVELVLGDATSLQLNSSIYDKVTISFGIRNIPDIDGALREMRRVAKRGAVLGILEFALPERGLLAPVARAFVSVVVPVLGAVLSLSLIHI